MRVSILAIMMCCAFAGNAQKMPKDYYAEGNDFFMEGKYKEALGPFQYLVSNYPGSEWYPTSYFNLGYIFYELGDYSKAMNIMRGVLAGDFNDADKRNVDLMSNPYANYKHSACKILSRIFEDRGELDSAIYYFQLSKEKYHYAAFCGNAAAEIAQVDACRYASLYMKLGKKQLALEKLLPYSFASWLVRDNNMVIDTLAMLLKGKTGLQAELDAAIINMHRLPGDSSTTYLDYYITFMGTELRIPEKVGDEHIEKMAKDFDKVRTITLIHQTAFYKMVAALK